MDFEIAVILACLCASLWLKPWRMLVGTELLTPLLAWCLARVFELDTTQTSVLLAFSALPTASSGYVLAARMGYNGPYVAGLVTLSTLSGMWSLPFALGVLR